MIKVPSSWPKHNLESYRYPGGPWTSLELQLRYHLISGQSPTATSYGAMPIIQKKKDRITTGTFLTPVLAFAVRSVYLVKVHREACLHLSLDPVPSHTPVTAYINPAPHLLPTLSRNFNSHSTGKKKPRNDAAGSYAQSLARAS
jgi:hypothetical protein